MSNSLVAVAAMVTSTAAVAANPAEHPEIKVRLDVLDAFNAAFVERNALPSLTAGVVYDGQLIWRRSYGNADLDRAVPAQPSTVYRIGSLSKAFTTIALLQLQQQGELDLDDSVDQYLPWFRPLNTFENQQAITVRQLLEHRSGLPMDAPGVNWNDYSLPTRGDVVSNFETVELLFPPGYARYYSNLGFWVAGEVVAAVSGEKISEYVRRHVTDPLGMRHTTLKPVPETPGLARGYGPRQVRQERYRWPFTDTSFYTAAGDGASSVIDMARWLAFLMSGDESGDSAVLASSAIRTFWANSKDSDPPDISLLHGGDGGGFFAAYRAESRSGLGVIVLINADDGDPLPSINLAFNLLEGPLDELADGELAATEVSQSWIPYFGTYRSRYGRAQILASQGQLYIADPRDDNPWSSMMELLPTGRHTFRIVEVPPSYGEPITFDVGSDGVVKGIRFSNGYQVKD